MIVAAVLFASGVVHLGVLVVDGSTWEGPLSFRKAATFGLSFGLTLASVAWATSFVEIRPRVRAALLGTLSVASVVEVALVTTQVWRGRPSHVNFETPLDDVISMTLAVGGGVIIVVALAFTAAAIRTRAEPAMTLALRLGFVMLVVALATGAVMIGRAVPLARSGREQEAYDTIGSLKPLHGVAMHAILVVPGIAWLSRSVVPAARRLRLVQVAAVAYVLFVIAVGIALVVG